MMTPRIEVARNTIGPLPAAPQQANTPSEVNSDPPKGQSTQEIAVKRQPGGRARCWMFTASVNKMSKNAPIENFPEIKIDDETAPIRGLQHPIDHKNIVFMVYQLEQGKETGYLHWQGCVTFDNSVSVSMVQDRLGIGKAHVESVRNQEAAIRYCQKKDSAVNHPHNTFRIGDEERIGQGARTELLDLKKTLDDEKIDISEAYDKHFVTMAKYDKFALRYKSARVKPRNGSYMPKCVFFYGTSGAGKSHLVFEAEGGCEYVYVKDTTEWWDGYYGQKAICFEEFNPKDWTREAFCKIVDKWPYKGQFKGGYVNINSPTIYFCTNLDPTPFINSHPSITRRVTDIVKFDSLFDINGTIEKNEFVECEPGEGQPEVSAEGLEHY